jgi:hypothetical protein
MKSIPFWMDFPIMITSKDEKKIAFITNWGAFVGIVMPFGLKNVPVTY